MRYAIIVILIVLVLLGIWWIMMAGTDEPQDMQLDGISEELPGTGDDPATTTPTNGADDETPNGTPDAADPITEDSEPQETTVTYTTSGFSPATVTVDSGTTVTFVNESGRAMWVASGVHPTHSVYDGTSLSQHCPDPDNSSFDQCAAGNTYSFTFDRAGTWGYHNHQGPQHTGTVIVE